MEEKLIFGSYFWRPQFMICWSAAFGTLVAQSIMTQSMCGGSKLTTSWCPEGKERKEESGWGLNISFKSTSPKI
jgi:hypothetical protein